MVITEPTEVTLLLQEMEQTTINTMSHIAGRQITYLKFVMGTSETTLYRDFWKYKLREG